MEKVINQDNMGKRMNTYQTGDQTTTVADQTLPAISHIMALLEKTHIGDKEAMADCVSCLLLVSRAWSAQNARVLSLENQCDMLRSTVQNMLVQIEEMSKVGPSDPPNSPPPVARKNTGLIGRLATSLGF